MRMMKRTYNSRLWRILQCFGILIHICGRAGGMTIGHWWNMGFLSWRSARMDRAYIIAAAPMCHRLAGLSPRQAVMCQNFYDHMPAVSVGAHIGMHECRRQFLFRKWNCTTPGGAAAFGPGTDRATREAGFAHAVSAAGVVHSVARACKNGQLERCGCSRALRPDDLHRDWIWGGCGDNIQYAYDFAKHFIDVRELEKNYPRHSGGLAKTLMNLHNNEAGRQGVYRLADISCKCHGVSGSCSLKTCWQQLAQFPEVGKRLMKRYDQATKVRFNKRGSKLRRSSVYFKRPTRQDVIFIDDSPDYCSISSAAGSLGTRGRRCNDTSLGTEGCKKMCCGRGYSTQEITVEQRCKCKFHWCCQVQCKICVKRIKIHTCK